MLETKHKIYIDHKAYKNKPSKALIIDIGERITNSLKELKPQEIADLVGNQGHTMLLAEMDGKRDSENMISQSIVALDFDKGTRIAEIMQDPFIQINAAFLYKTFSYSEDLEKFRVVFFLDKPLTSNAQIRAVYEFLMNKYPTADKATKDSARLFLGGLGAIEIDYRNKLDISGICLTEPLEITYQHTVSNNPVSEQEAIELVTKYAKRNKSYLMDYEFYNNCHFVIRNALNTGVISLSVAEQCVTILACGNPQWEAENINKLRAERGKIRNQKHFKEWFNDGSAIQSTPSRKEGGEQEDKFITKPERALTIVYEHAEELYFTNENLAYIKIPFQGKSRIVGINSQTFKSWLVYLYQQKEGKILTDSDVRTVMTNLNSTAEMVGTRRDIYLRLAEVEDRIYLDLCNDREQVLEISSEGFRVLDESPVLFKQNDDLAEIPIPIFEDKEDYKRLKNYLNVKNNDDFIMIVAFILSSFRQKIPKPILNLTGEAGTGKSTNTRIIRQFTDPAKMKSLLKKEINTSEIQVAAFTQYLLAFDNLSGISAEGSDLLCTMSTGGATTKKKLYTDTEEIIVDLKKSVILNGIDEISKRPDLVSRTIFIETPKLDEGKRKTEAEIWTAFKQDYPYILGSLVNAVSEGLKNKGQSNESYSRMLDFGRFIEECAPALNWEKEDWQRVYSENQNTGIQNSIESDPFISNLIALLYHARDIGKNEPMEVTASQLVSDILAFSNDSEAAYNKAYPKSNQVKGRLKRSASLLEAENVIWHTRKSKGQILYVFDLIEE